MIKTFCLTLWKGGTGRTSSTVNLGYETSRLGMKTLLIDTDPQANCTQSFGIDPSKLQYYISQIFESNKYEPEKLIVETEFPNLFILPANAEMANIITTPPMASEQAIKRFLIKVWEEFDFCYIDTPPGTNIATTAGLTAATDALLPIQCETYALQGISITIDTITKAQEFLNDKLKIGGTFLTMVDERPTFTKNVIQEVKDYFKGNMFNTMIHNTIRIPESQNFCKPVSVYEPKNAAAEDYRNLTKEVINRQ
jgi:chromosome partitioning protein